MRPRGEMYQRPAQPSHRYRQERPQNGPRARLKTRPNATGPISRPHHEGDFWRHRARRWTAEGRTTGYAGHTRIRGRGLRSTTWPTQTGERHPLPRRLASWPLPRRERALRGTHPAPPRTPFSKGPNAGSDSAAGQGPRARPYDGLGGRYTLGDARDAAARGGDRSAETPGDGPEPQGWYH